MPANRSVAGLARSYKYQGIDAQRARERRGA
jgi:hypothetical protein